MRRVGILAAAAALAVAMTATVAEGMVPAASERSNMILIGNWSYYPKTLQVAPGTLVTVAHEQSGIPHSVTARDGSFDTGVFTGSIRDFTAPQTPGRYPYSCKVHGPRVMRGVVVVTAGPGVGT
jgi:plastocyanin